MDKFYPLVLWDDDEATLNAYFQNYCDNYSEQLAERYLFVEELQGLTGNQTEFNRTCTNLTNSNPNLNAWFDPIALLPSITVDQVCAGQWDALSGVAADPENYDNTNAYVEASYQNSLGLNLEGQLRDDYANCINLDVVDDPNEWATSYLEGHTSFLIWTENEKMTVAAEAAAEI